MGSLMNWFFVLAFISLTTTFFISTLNSDINTKLDPNTESPDIIQDYISSGTLVVYETNFFGFKSDEAFTIGINNLQSSDEATIQINNEDYLTVFMNEQGLVFTGSQDITNKYVAELSITRTSDGLARDDDFNIYLQQNLINRESSIKTELLGNGIKEVFIETSLISENNAPETVDVAYSEVYESTGTLTNLGNRVGDNVLGNLLTGIAGMPAWFNTLFALITTMTAFLAVLIIRGVN